MSPLVLEQGPLALVFTSQLDRYGHKLLFHGAPVLTSCDAVVGGWPASPPFQQASQENLAEGETVFLVGMAGGSHWSAAASQREGGFRIDVACRLRDPSAQLISTYDLASGWEVTSLAAAGIVLRQAEPDLLELAVEAGEQAILTCSDGQLKIRPRWEPTETPQTVRWCYNLKSLDLSP